MPEAGQTRAERARQSILDAAYKLFTHQGYAATSMRQLREASGVALGSLYNHFSSKEAIFNAILDERHPFLQILPILSSVKGESVDDFCRTAAHTLVDQMGNHPEFLNLMLTEIVEFKGQHVPALFEKFLPMLMPLAQRLRSLEGQMRDIPPFVLARAFLGMFFSYYITGILMGRAMPPAMQENALDHFVDIFLYGVLVKETA
jgi:AcrR family transcriptional regulator